MFVARGRTSRFFPESFALYYGDYGYYCLFRFSSPGAILGIIADRKIKKSMGLLKGRVFSISGKNLGLLIILIPLISLLIPFRSDIREPAKRVICGTNLVKLGKAIPIYADDNDCRYPTPDMWCDLLVEPADVNKKNFICKGASESGDKCPCHYALNPNCSPNSPNDVVLLFETKGGWNQHGGPELLTTKHHKGVGCNVCFKDFHVNFVITEQLDELKWNGEPENKPNQ